MDANKLVIKVDKGTSISSLCVWNDALFAGTVRHIHMWSKDAQFVRKIELPPTSLYFGLDSPNVHSLCVHKNSLFCVLSSNVIINLNERGQCIAQWSHQDWN